MKPLLSFITALAMLLPGIWEAKASEIAKTTIVLVGDSTVSDYDPAQTLRGWGQMIATHAAPGVQVINCARSGASSKSFRATNGWSKAITAKPDIIFIQFGHNDRADDEARGTQPEGEYRTNLKDYIAEARAIGAKPILVTPPVPRAFSLKNGKLGNGRLAPYVAEMKKVGEEEGVPVLDLFTRSFDWFKEIGQERAKESAPREGDINHYNEAGAEMLATFVLDEMKAKAPEAYIFFTPTK